MDTDMLEDGFLIQRRGYNSSTLISLLKDYKYIIDYDIS